MSRAIEGVSLEFNEQINILREYAIKQKPTTKYLKQEHLIYKAYNQLAKSKDEKLKLMEIIKDNMNQNIYFKQIYQNCKKSI